VVNQLSPSRPLMLCLGLEYCNVIYFLTNKRVLVNRELKTQRTRELRRSSSCALSPFFSLYGCRSEIRSLPALRPSSVSGWFNLVHTTTSQGLHPTPKWSAGRRTKQLVPLPRQGHELNNRAAPGSSSS
jgi:hypothetical protein